jgi:hypothetical protein
MRTGWTAWLAALAIGLAAVGAVARAQPLGPPPETISLLGDSLYAPALADTVRARYERKLAEARQDFDHAPNEVNNIIWLGRRTAYLGRFRDAIAIAGIATSRCGSSSSRCRTSPTRPR